jgi:hypothetical protein
MWRKCHVADSSEKLRKMRRAGKSKVFKPERTRNIVL